MRVVGNIKLYDLNELEEILGLSKVTIRNYIKSGLIKARKIGVKWYIAEPNINHFLKVDKTVENSSSLTTSQQKAIVQNNYEFSDLSTNLLIDVKIDKPKNLLPTNGNLNTKPNLHQLAKAYEKIEEQTKISSYEMWLNRDGSLITISPLCEIVTGYTTKDFIFNQHLYIDIIHPEDRKLAITSISEALISSKPLSIDLRIITRKNELKHINISSKIEEEFENSDNKKVFVVKDITDVKLKEISKSNPFLEILCTNYDLDLIVFDANLNIIEVSGITKLNSLFLFNVEPSIGSSFSEVIPEENQYILKQYINQAQNGFSGYFTLEHSYKGLSKEYIYRVFPAEKKVRNRNLHPIPVMVVIEEHKKSANGSSNPLFIDPKTYNSCPYMILVLDNNFIIRDINFKFSKQTGYDKFELFGKSITQILEESSKAFIQKNPICDSLPYYSEIVLNIINKENKINPYSCELIQHIGKDNQMLVLGLLYPLL